jgi:hypothetical protein
LRARHKIPSSGVLRLSFRQNHINFSQHQPAALTLLLGSALKTPTIEPDDPERTMPSSRRVWLEKHQ